MAITGAAGMTHGITEDTGAGTTLGITEVIGAVTLGTAIIIRTIADGTEAGDLYGDTIITTALSTEAEASGTAGTVRDMRPKTTAGSSQTGPQPAEASAQAAA